MCYVVEDPLEAMELTALHSNKVMELTRKNRGLVETVI